MDKSNLADVTYKKLLEEELYKLQKNNTRLPWEDGLPETIKNSLDPLKDQLENSYKSILNPLEFKNAKDFEWAHFKKHPMKTHIF